jgi:hypothetical protein
MMLSGRLNTGGMYDPGQEYMLIICNEFENVRAGYMLKPMLAVMGGRAKLNQRRFDRMTTETILTISMCRAKIDVALVKG